MSDPSENAPRFSPERPPTGRCETWQEAGEEMDEHLAAAVTR